MLSAAICNFYQRATDLSDKTGECLTVSDIFRMFISNHLYYTVHSFSCSVVSSYCQSMGRQFKSALLQQFICLWTSAAPLPCQVHWGCWPYTVDWKIRRQGTGHPPINVDADKSWFFLIITILHWKTLPHHKCNRNPSPNFQSATQRWLRQIRGFSGCNGNGETEKLRNSKAYCCVGYDSVGELGWTRRWQGVEKHWDRRTRWTVERVA